MKRIILTVFGSALLAASVWADAAGDAGRAILKKHQDSVVSVKVTIMVNMGGQRNEAKLETLGTILDSTGLTVVSLSSVEPGAMLSRMRFPGGEGPETELGDVKLVLGDETEIPAAVVLRDKDLDLAFLRPLEKLTGTVTPVDLATATAKAAVLDEIIVLARLSKVGSRVPAAMAGRIESYIEKPRPLYVSTRLSSLGSPVFTLDGKLLGIVLVRAPEGDGAGSGNPIPVILPARDVAETAKQAPATAPKQEKKPTAAKPAAEKPAEKPTEPAK